MRLRNWTRATLEKTSGKVPLWVAVAVTLLAAYALGLSPLPFSVASLPEILDSKLGYGPDEGRAVLDALGDDGRKRYADFLKADAVFLLIYPFALVNAIFAIYRGSRLVRLVAVPAAIAGFDAVEVISVALALDAYPGPADGALVVASAAGGGKYLTFVASILLVLIGLITKAAGRGRDGGSGIRQTSPSSRSSP